MAYPGFQRGGGCLRSGPIQKVGGGASKRGGDGGGGGALQVRYTKSGGAFHFRSDTLNPPLALTLVAAVMSIQTTLFGGVLKDDHKSPMTLKSVMHIE